MELTKHEITFDTDQIRSDVAALAESLGERAERAAGRAAEWVAPAVDRARTGADRLAKETAEAAKEAQERIEVLNEDTRSRAERAASAARTAIEAPGTVTERAQRATVAAVNAAQTPAPRKSRRVLKSLCWLTVAGVAAGAAYVVWRRSQPVEDPWAEEYWADSTDDVEDADAK
ncbi:MULTISPECIES: hypothetical protein [unclassified Actinomyces]|uniref:hypothetical protein n=1 Tax=unclassified Actinomyces TaxID=2609248 RepID=UPI0020174BF4|nr:MULTISPECIES: hypothetical protein [unclassified Actinomyces]MCL3778537.1 hypothetical protein [Actinomyces sp. AC-20-1]MCL3789490.1 hypothetical protein [Actinomyces sp. 187325]MCL3791819.1 hypothetical protein [Actinomyces sp. 186855]MCL3793498.1 hypothetical protein [Actinomyces sp. 217892]